MGMIQGLARDVAVLKEQGASMEAPQFDVEYLQVLTVNTAESMLEAQQEWRRVQQSSDLDAEAEQGYHADFIESEAALHRDLVAARINHVNTVEPCKTHLGQLEAAHTSPAQIAGMHGSELSRLEAAHGDYAPKVESHGAELREPAKSHEFHLGVVKMHRARLFQLGAAHARSHRAKLMEKHKRTSVS